jgi:hypothetical protein
MPNFSKKFKGKLLPEQIKTSAIGGGGSIRMAKYQIYDRRSLREWWHTILRSHGKYPCYAIFLVLPSDKQVTKYLYEYGKELHFVSGQNCLILVLGSNFYYTIGLYEDTDHRRSDDYLIESIATHVSQGESIQIAKLFGIKVTDFPCLLFFTDIRSTDFAIVSLRELDKDKVSQELRWIFSVIDESVKEKKDIVDSIRIKSMLHNAENKGNKILEVGSSLTGKTIETAIEVLIKAMIR